MALLGLLAPSAFLVAVPHGFAFSKIERSDGSLPESKEGIVSVPLPPIPTLNGSSPARRLDIERAPEPQDMEGTDEGEVPLSPEDERRIEERKPGGEDGRSPRLPGTAKPFVGGSSAEAGDASDGTAPFPIDYGETGLPKPVGNLRKKLMSIAKSGDVAALRPYLDSRGDETILSLGEEPDDPIRFLKTQSGDGEGLETLAILREVLEAGHTHIQPGQPDELYVWPYFTQMRIDKLTKAQKVELFELVTAGDYEAMKSFGAYNFYRVGITPDGRLRFFVAGD